MIEKIIHLTDKHLKRFHFKRSIEKMSFFDFNCTFDEINRADKIVYRGKFGIKVLKNRRGSIEILSHTPYYTLIDFL